MKKALFALAAVAMASSAFADATITFGNRTIDKKDGSGTYNVPIWKDGSTTAGAGTLAGGVTVGLFFNGTQLLSTTGTPVQSALRTDANAQFFATSSQTANVPGINPGTTQTLEVRAWQGASFANALATPGQQSSGPAGSWTFTTKALGGIDPVSGNPVFTPGMTGWGPESGAGLALVTTVPEPTTIAFGALGIGALLLRRRK